MLATYISYVVRDKYTGSLGGGATPGGLVGYLGFKGLISVELSPSDLSLAECSGGERILISRAFEGDPPSYGGGVNKNYYIANEPNSE
jgi:hypothetical protein